jgi:hypothetical protein
MSAWQDRFEAGLDVTLEQQGSEMTETEEESMAAAKEIGIALLTKFLKHATSVGWASQTPADRIEGVEEVLRRPQVPQRTPAWYLQGKTVLTASEFATLYGSPRAVGQLVLSKVPVAAVGTVSANRLACMTCEMSSLDWGVRFEPVVKQILARRWGTVIVDSGRIMHPTDPNLAASPDGFIMDATDPAKIGRLIEIKCPIRRAIGEGIPFEYWCQMQIQMEVTGIGECEYVEVKLDSVEKGRPDLSGEADGFLWLLQNDTTCEMRYAYTAEEYDGFDLQVWTMLERIPWRVAGLYTETVVRDRGWYASTEEMRTRFWEEVAKAKAGAFAAPAVHVRSPKLTVNVTKSDGCQITDD